MTLYELLDSLCESGHIRPSRAKDLKTSIRYLTQAAESIPGTNSEAENLESRYKSLLKSYFASLNPIPSPYTVRNTLNNLSFLYRTARACHMIRVAPPRPTKHTMIQSIKDCARTSPYRARTMVCHMPYRFPVEEWPAAIREPWIDYKMRRALTTRPITLYRYEQLLKSYVSFGLKIDDPPMTTWDQFFEIPRLTRFIQWHTKRVNAPRISDSAHRTVSLLITLARESQRPESTTLEFFKQQLPTPEPMHNKQHPDHSLSLKELEQVGLTLLAEARNPLRSPGRKTQPSIHRASRHRTSLMLRLLVRIPMRVRNISEMKIGQNLYKDRNGIWQIRFQGEELKVSERGGRMNILHLPFPPDLVKHLEEYLDHYRPILARTPEEVTVFLGHFGRPMKIQVIRQELSNQVYFHTDGKRFYPHLIRTIWTDTCLLQTHDVSTTAFMLNDRPETVLHRYHELRANDHIKKADDFIHSLLA